MRFAFKAGDRVRLCISARAATKPARTGVVLAVSRSGTQCRVKWDGLKWPERIYIRWLELAADDGSSANGSMHAPT
jgi:hypothetical protein